MSINDLVESIDTTALRAAFQSGAIRTCPFHSDVAIRVGDPNLERKAFAIATNKLKADGTVAFLREDAMKAVKAVLDEADDECAQSEKYREG